LPAGQTGHCFASLIQVFKHFQVMSNVSDDQTHKKHNHKKKKKTVTIMQYQPH